MKTGSKSTKTSLKNGLILDRDINASKKILEEGLEIIGAERSDNPGSAP